MQAQLPQGWVPEVAIIDAMFVLTVKPMRMNATILDHSKFLFNRFALPHFIPGATKVYLIFDKPNRQAFDPKIFKRKRRDRNISGKQHTCISFTSNMLIPGKWMDYIACHNCKCSIVEALGLLYFQCRPADIGTSGIFQC